MRNLLIVVLSLLIFGCSKDKFTTAPQVKFKSVKPSRIESGTLRTDQNIPVLTVHITDGDGDVGFKGGKTSFLYVKNILTSKLDSFLLPDLSSVAGKNFEADAEVNLFNVLGGTGPGPGPGPKTDTLFFEVYLTDF